MRAPRLAAAVALISGLAISTSAWAPPGGNNGKGGQGGGQSDVRLCANFNNFDSAPYPPAPYTIDDDLDSVIAPYQYCDGYDGEILMGLGEGFVKLETIHRDDAPINRMVRVTMDTADPVDGCEIVDPLDPSQPVNLAGTLLEAFFGWQQEEYVSPLGCAADDPFDTYFGDPGYDVASLECLEGSGQRLMVADIPEGETRYQSWEVRYSDPELSAKKGGLALRAQFAGDRGTTCPVLSGGRPGGLPVAMHCDNDVDDDGRCDEFSVRTFRFCMSDYDPAKGGNWHMAYSGCPMNVEITFAPKPE